MGHLSSTTLTFDSTLANSYTAAARALKKTRLLARMFIHWINMNADIENAVKTCLTCWQVGIGADQFNINNSNILNITDYDSKFPIVRQTESLIKCCKFIFAEYG